MTPVTPAPAPAPDDGWKLFGRSPTLWVGLLVALISFASTLGFRFLGEDQAGAWIAVVNGLAAAVLAWTTRPLLVAPFAYVITALAALGATYGLEITPEQVAGLNALLIPILTILTYGNVSPVRTAITKSSKDPNVAAAEHDGIPTARAA